MSDTLPVFDSTMQVVGELANPANQALAEILEESPEQIEEARAAAEAECLMSPAEILAARKHLAKKKTVKPKAKQKKAHHANTLKRNRKALDLTLAEVGRGVKITGGYLNILENGDCLPSLQIAIRLAKFYGTKIEEIWSEAK